MTIRLPGKCIKAGMEIRTRLQEMGLTRTTGQEHFWGAIVVPIMDTNGVITEVYGRRKTGRTRPGLSQHIYLPGPHKGIFNPHCLVCDEVIVCESIIDALSFWVNGQRNVTANYGVHGYTKELIDLLATHKVKKIYIAYDNDPSGNQASEVIAGGFTARGIECYRVLFPMGMDANDFICQCEDPSNQLKHLIKVATKMGEVSPLPLPTEPPKVQNDQHIPSLAAEKLAAKNSATKEKKVEKFSTIRENGEGYRVLL